MKPIKFRNMFGLEEELQDKIEELQKECARWMEKCDLYRQLSSTLYSALDNTLNNVDASDEVTKGAVEAMNLYEELNKEI